MLTPPLPLVLDLDGTLIHTDTFHEMMVHLLIHNPWMLLLLPFWFLKGRAFAKTRLVEHTDLCPSHLPYNMQLLEFVQTEHNKGRPLILATGSDQKVAEKIAAHLGFFQDVIGSQGGVNMTGLHKCQALVTRFGHQGFDYAGDSPIDAHVWRAARKALVVHPKRGVLKTARTLKGEKNTHHFPRIKRRFVALLFALRCPFWVFSLAALSWPIAIGLSLISSGLFIVNDLFTLYQERTNPGRNSIFAEGTLHLSTAFILSPLLILLGLAFFLFTLPYGWLFASLYTPLFLLCDRLSRHFPQILRWSLLGTTQIIYGFALGILFQ